MSDRDLITVDVEWLSGEIKNVPHLSERALLDVANGIEVVEGQLAFKSRQGFFSRLWGSFDGSNQRRESIIQQTQQATMRGLMDWASELAVHESMTKQALVCVAKKLQSTRSDLAEVAKHSAENRKLIEENRSLIEDLSAKVTRVQQATEGRLGQLESQAAIHRRVTAWSAGRIYSGYSPIVSVAYLVDDLIRGGVGQRILADKDLRHYLKDSVVKELRNRGLGPDTARPNRDLLLNYGSETREQKALASWLLRIGPDVSLHQTIADTREVDDGLACVLEAERKGHVVPVYSAKTLTGKLMREASHVFRSNG